MSLLICYKNVATVPVFEGDGDDGIAVVIIEHQDVVVASACWCDKLSCLICVNLTCWLQYCCITVMAVHVCWVLGWKAVCSGIVCWLGFSRSLVLVCLVHMPFVHGDGLWWMELEAMESESSKFGDVVVF